jgi:hypothetical protein
MAAAISAAAICRLLLERRILAAQRESEANLFILRSKLPGSEAAVESLVRDVNQGRHSEQQVAGRVAQSEALHEIVFALAEQQNTSSSIDVE